MFLALEEIELQAMSLPLGQQMFLALLSFEDPLVEIFGVCEALECSLTVHNLPGSARPCRGGSFEKMKRAIRKQWPIGKCLRCRRNEVLKL